MAILRVFAEQHGSGARIDLTAIQLFVGQLTRIDDEGQWTGIYKKLVTEPLWLGSEGFATDVQADRRVHGGIEKAVHHYPLENYTRLAVRFPEIADRLLAGTIGENVSTFGWDEGSVCFGDIFSLGGAVVQLSQPRSPCWKIDKRYNTSGLASHIAENGLTGWYYRVLESGEVAPGSAFRLLQRNASAVTLREFHTLWSQHRPDPEQLIQLSLAPGLNSGWQKKVLDRVAWLKSNTPN